MSKNNTDSSGPEIIVPNIYLLKSRFIEIFLWLIVLFVVNADLFSKYPNELNRGLSSETTLLLFNTLILLVGFKNIKSNMKKQLEKFRTDNPLLKNEHYKWFAVTVRHKSFTKLSWFGLGDNKILIDKTEYTKDRISVSIKSHNYFQRFFYGTPKSIIITASKLNNPEEKYILYASKPIKLLEALAAVNIFHRIEIIS